VDDYLDTRSLWTSWSLLTFTLVDPMLLAAVMLIVECSLIPIVDGLVIVFVG
jgi:hypothetical protein